MTDKEKLINELKESGNIISILDKVKNKLSFIEMLKLAGNLSDKKKEIVYDYALNNYNVSVDDVSLILKNDIDMAIFIRRLVNKKDILRVLHALKYIHDESIISNLLNEIINTIMVSRMPKNDFEDEILNIIQNYEGYIGNDVLRNYLKYGYSIEKLVISINTLRYSQIKPKYYSFLFSCFREKLLEEVSDYGKLIMVYDCMDINEKKLAFDIMKSMDKPKLIEKDKVEKIFSNKNSLAIHEYFGELFMDVILERDVIDQYDTYKLLEKKDILSEETIIKIYEKSFSNISDYLVVLKYLDNDEKKVLTRIFIDNRYNNIDIIKRILKDKNYYKEDYDKLILLVGMYGSASIIYDTLMEEKGLSLSQTKMLEKSLLKTHDIEYIAYYYFFRNKEKFVALFGSALLFLSYVEINKKYFKNTIILETIVSKIKEDETEFVEEVDNKINISYRKERK